MPRFRMLLEYDGAPFVGWQVQKTGSSVQGCLEEALGGLFGKPVRVTGAGRTDAGVHALGQVAAFDAPARHAPETLRRALNAKTPPEIRVLRLLPAPDSFHPRYDARAKVYVYLIARGDRPSPFLSRIAWHVPAGLNTGAMRRGLAHLCGRHDFTSFRAAGCGARHPVRTLRSLRITTQRRASFLGLRVQDPIIRIRVEGDAFLRHMVRNIAGLAVDLGLGRIRPAEIPGILAARDRTRLGRTAPAHGLFLESVRYDGISW